MTLHLVRTWGAPAVIVLPHPFPHLASQKVNLSAICIIRASAVFTA
jgi:hypothetical protein